MKIGESRKLPSCPCPSCGKALDGCSQADGDSTPKPGDITICIYCGHIMAFADDLAFRELNDEEVHAIAGDPRIIRIQKAMKALQREPAA
jgi:hypothetical protein